MIWFITRFVELTIDYETGARRSTKVTSCSRLMLYLEIFYRPAINVKLLTRIVVSASTSKTTAELSARKEPETIIPFMIGSLRLTCEVKNILTFKSSHVCCNVIVCNYAKRIFSTYSPGSKKKLLNIKTMA